MMEKSNPPTVGGTALSMQDPSIPTPKTGAKQQPDSDSAFQNSSGNYQAEDARVSGATGSSSKSNRFRVFFDTLKYVEGRGSKAAQSSSSGRNGRSSVSISRVPLFVNTPGERALDVVSRQTGRAMSELEILQEKHQPEFKQLVPIVAEALTGVLARHAELARTVGGAGGAAATGGGTNRYAIYETNAVPGICMVDYVTRFADYTYISPSTLLASLILMDRLSSRHPTLLFTQLNVYKLFFVAVRVASKVVDLRTLNNKNFAHVGGINNRHLNELEAQFLIDVRFDLYLPPGEFQMYVNRIMPIAGKAE